MPDSPVSNLNKTATTMRVGTATGQEQIYDASYKLPLPDLPPGLFGNLMSGFTHNIFGIGNLCDKYCKVVFTKNSIIIYDSNNQTVLKGWRETSGARLWRISLRPFLRTDIANYPPCHEDPENDAQEGEATLEAFSSYDLPSVKALVV